MTCKPSMADKTVITGGKRKQDTSPSHTGLVDWYQIRPTVKQILLKISLLNHHPSSCFFFFNNTHATIGLTNHTQAIVGQGSMWFIQLRGSKADLVVLSSLQLDKQVHQKPLGFAVNKWLELITCNCWKAVHGGGRVSDMNAHQKHASCTE